jgi:hypothetical protein
VDVAFVLAGLIGTKDWCARPRLSTEPDRATAARAAPLADGVRQVTSVFGRLSQN